MSGHRYWERLSLPVLLESLVSYRSMTNVIVTCHFYIKSDPQFSKAKETPLQGYKCRLSMIQRGQEEKTREVISTTIPNRLFSEKKISTAGGFGDGFAAFAAGGRCRRVTKKIPATDPCSSPPDIRHHPMKDCRERYLLQPLQLELD